MLSFHAARITKVIPHDQRPEVKHPSLLNPRNIRKMIAQEKKKTRPSGEGFQGKNNIGVSGVLC
jgi:hypothetical protein